MANTEQDSTIAVKLHCRTVITGLIVVVSNSVLLLFHTSDQKRPLISSNTPIVFNFWCYLHGIVQRPYKKKKILEFGELLLCSLSHLMTL